MSDTADVQVLNHGSIWQFLLLSPAGEEWAEENVDMSLGGMGMGNFVCEHRYAADIVVGMRADGLEVIGE